MPSRAHNFSAGPAVLPLEVIHELQAALPNYNNIGLGLMEMSHRSKDFDDIIGSANHRLRTLLMIPEDYQVLFLQGGASLQFYMSALNMLDPNSDETGAYINTGTWSTKAIKEAKRCGNISTIWEPQDGIFNKVPTTSEYSIPENSLYLHYTSNNTIYGTQFPEIPSSSAPLIGDYSSDIASAQIDIAKHAIVYAGAQKNLGPSGVTAVILSPWAVERSRYLNEKYGLPSMLNYGLMVDKNSMFNTPNTFGIFALDRMLAWLERQGGVEAISKKNREKAEKIYSVLDSSDFWVPHAEQKSRSIMNITWRIANTDLEEILLQEAEKHQLKGLKGHRSVGGLRASIYNACPAESVGSLVEFLTVFESRYG